MLQLADIDTGIFSAHSIRELLLPRPYDKESQLPKSSVWQIGHKKVHSQNLL